MTTPSRFSTAQIRTDFLKFFAERGHTVVPSAPLVPGNDPTLLFTNSGMVQFKDVLLGAEKRSYVRAVDVQRCLRAGGKHNDLDAVGYTARHHTFFEMLGNWSFGEYFKKEAIIWAWKLLTAVWKLPAQRLLVTVYHNDDEAYDIWHTVIGLSPDRIIRIGDNKGAPYASDNFWQMADTGPCGPCSEIFYDHGPDYAGGPPGSADEDGDRFIEIWNLVFMQFDRHADGTLVPLPAPCVDTGMGLERLAAVLQKVHSNYEIDLFTTLISKAAELTQTRDLQNKSLRVIADHIRACAFLIVDGVLPSNEGRGYVLRRIIRRALRHGWMLSVRQPFFSQMLPTLLELMGEAYPELVTNAELVTQTLHGEELRFAETLDSGMKIFEEIAANCMDTIIPGEAAFRLYDTYGFPLDLTADIARERGLSIDIGAFEAAMEQQRQTARAAGKFSGGAQLPADKVASLPATVFLGYEQLQADQLNVVALLKEGVLVNTVGDGESVIVFTDKTPFYAESGGQVGDTGKLHNGKTQLTVSDTQKFAGQFYGHICQVNSGQLSVGDDISGEVDAARRAAIVLNHSAAHLLHSALRELLGPHVQQKGSLVAADRLRFDFSHPRPVSSEELVQIERRVNAHIRANHAVHTEHMSLTEALDKGVMALFGEKYGERVRVLEMGDCSTELCGGTHVKRTGDIGLCKITAESGISAGVRRIEAVTGQTALDYVNAEHDCLVHSAALLGCGVNNVLEKINQLRHRQKKLEQELDELRAKTAGDASVTWAAVAITVGQIKVLAKRVENFDNKALREAVDRLKQHLGDCVVVLAGVKQGKVTLVAGVNGAALDVCKAGELVQHIAAQIGGKGGGRADLAQGGGEDSPALMQALETVPHWLSQRLS